MRFRYAKSHGNCEPGWHAFGAHHCASAFALPRAVSIPMRFRYAKSQLLAWWAQGLRALGVGDGGLCSLVSRRLDAKHADS